VRNISYRIISSLAVMIYEALAGQLPFRSETAMGFIQKHLVETPPPITTLKPDLPSDLDSVIGTALAKDKNARPARASEFVRAVRETLSASAATVGHAGMAAPASTRAAVGALTVRERTGSTAVAQPSAPSVAAPKSAAAGWAVPLALLLVVGASVAAVAAAGVGLFAFRNQLFGPSVAVYPVGDSPRVALYDGKTVWVANALGNSVAQLQASGCDQSPDPCGQPFATYPVDVLPIGLAHDGHSLWVASALHSTLTQLDPQSGAALAEFQLPNVPSALLLARGSLWTANQFANTLSNAPAVPGFTILGVAGKGGMGVVYKAEQAAPRRIVALKVLRGASASPESLANFRREAQVIVALEHPHIVPLYSFGEHEGAPYLALRFIGGGSVADRIAQGPINLSTAARWVAAIAEALDFAHQRGIVHRDIKPSNILLDERSNAYLGDFGIAGTLASASSGPPTGSAAYMPPEQGRGESVDGRGDIYALAVTLFEMLTGQKPYTAETALGVIVRHLNDPIPSARALNSNIPPAVDKLIQWSMAKDAASRPQTAAEFARLLRQAVARPHESIRAATTSAPTVAASAAVTVPIEKKSNVGLWIGLAAAIGLLCVIGLAVTLGGGAIAVALFGSPTPIPKATALPTTTPPPTPTPAGQLLADDFSVPRSGFATASDADGSVEYADGSLRITVNSKGIEWFSPSGRVDAADIVIEATAKQESGPALTEMAVICRWRDNANYTAFAISADGSYSIWQKREGTTTRFVDWNPAPGSLLGFGNGITHHFRIICNGPLLRMEADGSALAEATDPNPISGDIALMAGMREEGQLVVTFDDVKVTKP